MKLVSLLEQFAVAEDLHLWGVVAREVARGPAQRQLGRAREALAFRRSEAEACRCRCGGALLLRRDG